MIEPHISIIRPGWSRLLILTAMAIFFITQTTTAADEPLELKSRAVSIEDIIVNTSSYQDKMVVIEGKIDSECGSGCWLNVSDTTAKIYVDNKPSNFVIPQKKGSNVKVYGKVSTIDGVTYIVGKMVEINDKIYQYNKKILISPSDVSDSDVILDVSPESKKYISGAVHIDYRKFADGSSMPILSGGLAKLLGDAGISRDNSVVIYGNDPSGETYVYWIMKHLGHENVKILDGGIDGWIAAGMPTSDKPKTWSGTSYVPSIKSDLTATYDDVRKGGVQVVDTRTPNEFKVGKLPGSENVPFDAVLDNGKIKSEAAVKKLFTGLSVDKPVVVYANDGIKATAVWYALELSGYNAKLYAGDEWISDLKSNTNAGGSVSAKPASAPSSSGSSGHSCH